ncbi:hypothetical protein [Coxiella endosymbiont of Ornithodoros maritimus]|uniref:hypothetical protein n=1 Tax=Coxiella endosymbiont of Ornithodoros maritimus TaxID=1656172 RepID=UPI002264C22B|nr:hypothetical protein [Coxiella endosymbiont of Ornithodoros maritimus]
MSQYAFQTGHPYWVYRFLGCSIHYAQDLIQPYHSIVVPNASAIKLITVSLLKRIGYTKPQRSVIQLSSNRHFTLENYTYHLLKHLLETKQKNN